MATNRERLDRLELRSQTIGAPAQAIVQVVGPGGRSSAQVAEAAAALAAGTQIIAIDFVDSRKSAARVDRISRHMSVIEPLTPDLPCVSAF